MKLITETLFSDFSVDRVLDEATGKKNLFIEGIFMQAEVKNRNGRIYPRPVLAKEVNRYIREYVDKGRAIGELNHPPSPSPNPERASHLITSLQESGNDFIGRAKVLNTPMGNIVTGLVDGGVQLGVSSRGLGSLKESNGVKVVQSDFYLSCVDIVGDPSAPSAFVNGLYEGAEWIYQDGKLVQTAEEIKKDMEKTKYNEQVAIEAFAKFITAIRKQEKEGK